MDLQSIIVVALALASAVSAGSILTDYGKCEPTEELVETFKTCFEKVTSKMMDEEGAVEAVLNDKDTLQNIGICGAVQLGIMEEGTHKFDDEKIMELAGKLTTDDAKNQEIVGLVKECFETHDDKDEKKDCVMHGIETACKS